MINGWNLDSYSEFLDMINWSVNSMSRLEEPMSRVPRKTIFFWTKEDWSMGRVIATVNPNFLFDGHVRIFPYAPDPGLTSYIYYELWTIAYNTLKRRFEKRSDNCQFFSRNPIFPWNTQEVFVPRDIHEDDEMEVELVQNGNGTPRNFDRTPGAGRPLNSSTAGAGAGWEQRRITTEEYSSFFPRLGNMLGGNDSSGLEDVTSEEDFTSQGSATSSDDSEFNGYRNTAELLTLPYPNGDILANVLQALNIDDNNTTTTTTSSEGSPTAEEERRSAAEAVACSLNPFETIFSLAQRHLLRGEPRVRYYENSISEWPPLDNDIGHCFQHLGFDDFPEDDLLLDATLPSDITSGLDLSDSTTKNEGAYSGITEAEYSPSTEAMAAAVAEEYLSGYYSSDTNEDPNLPPPILEINSSRYKSYRNFRKPKTIPLPEEIEKRNYLCVFCKGNNETEEVYKSHPIKIDGVVSCPYLRQHVCQICKATGDSAHTIKYCPQNKRGFFAMKAQKKAKQSQGDFETPTGEEDATFTSIDKPTTSEGVVVDNNGVGTEVEMAASFDFNHNKYKGKVHIVRENSQRNGSGSSRRRKEDRRSRIKQTTSKTDEED